MSEWNEIINGVPEKGVDCHVVRKWADGSLHTTTAKRDSDCELTIDEDASKNCWWANTSGRHSYFSDSSVIAWQYINKSAPEYHGRILPIEPIDVEENE